MNAHSPITAASPTLADTARAMLADERSDRFELAAAQTYLDNLADGSDEPGELLAVLAEADAREEYSGKDWLFDDWFDSREDEYVAERRVFHGMVGEAA